METSKIQLSPEELLLMKNEAWILTKNRAIEKMVHAMGMLGMEMQSVTKTSGGFLHPEWLISNPKVSRGEKYKGLPYIILDYPRYFEREDIFAIRTMFWWGNYCSVTLHVRGVLVLPVAKKIASHSTILSAAGFMISTSGDEWNHDLTSADYFPVSTLTQMPETNGFIKIAAMIELSQWNEMEAFLWEYFIKLLKIASI